ncbi:MAG: hypothetical protein QM679_06020 [Patulibacter sp.]
MPDATLRPREIPPIRTDWIADIAWRTAALGRDAIAALGDGSITLTDVVDGERWRITAFRVSQAGTSWVELDGDLYLPTDGDTATMRVGIALTPRWDRAHDAPIIEARVELGPRGAVTFDPENWVLRLPDPLGERPAITGVDAGRWEGVPLARPAAVPLDTLHGLTLNFGELVDIAEGGSTWTVALPAFATPPKRGFFARLRGGDEPDEPKAVLVVEADGPLTVDPAELMAGEDFPETGIVDRVHTADGQVKLIGDDLTAAGAWIGIGGTGVRVSAVSASA